MVDYMEAVRAYLAGSWSDLNDEEQEALRRLADCIAHDAFQPQAD